MPFPIDEKYIDATESKLGAKLPKSYTDAMRQHNGGKVQTPPDKWRLYPIFDSSDKKRLKRTCNDIVRETKVALNSDTFPKGAIAIGANGGGDQLIFLRTGDTIDPQVHWWDHETGQTILVANDLGDLDRCD